VGDELHRVTLAAGLDVPVGVKRFAIALSLIARDHVFKPVDPNVNAFRHPMIPMKWTGRRAHFLQKSGVKNTRSIL